MILLLEFVHGRVKVVEELVLELRVVDEVPLATGVVVAVVVSDAREVKPLRMTKLISCIEHRMLDLTISVRQAAVAAQRAVTFQHDRPLERHS